MGAQVNNDTNFGLFYIAMVELQKPRLISANTVEYRPDVASKGSYK